MTPPLKPTPVLLAANPYHGVLAAVRGLRAAGYAPWLAVHEAGTYAGRSRAAAGTVWVPDAEIDSEGFVSKLSAAAMRLSVAAVLPSTDTHFFTLADREADFPGVALGTPPLERVEQANDKGETLTDLAANVGLPVLPTARAIRGDSEAVSEFGFPAIVKPLRSRIRNSDGTFSACSTRYVSTRQAAEEAIEALPGKEGLVQPYIPGTVQSVTGVSWEGDLVCALHQVSVRIWPVRAGISSYAETIPPNAELEQGVGRLLQALGWSGLFQAQFIRSSHGEHYLIDLNPRIYGSLALAIAAGLNLPAIWVDLLLGRQPNVGGYRVGTRFRHEEKDIRTLACMLADGKPRDALRGLMPRRNTTHAVFSIRDPRPLLTSGTKLVAQLRR